MILVPFPLIHAASATDLGGWGVSETSMYCIAEKHLLLVKPEPLVLLQATGIFIPNLFLYFSLEAVCHVHRVQRCQTDHTQYVRGRFCFDLLSFMARCSSGSVLAVGSRCTPSQGQNTACFTPPLGSAGSRQMAWAPWLMVWRWGWEVSLNSAWLAQLALVGLTWHCCREADVTLLGESWHHWGLHWPGCSGL